MGTALAVPRGVTTTSSPGSLAGLLRLIRFIAKDFAFVKALSVADDSSGKRFELTSESNAQSLACSSRVGGRTGRTCIRDFASHKIVLDGRPVTAAEHISILTMAIYQYGELTGKLSCR